MVRGEGAGGRWKTGRFVRGLRGGGGHVGIGKNSRSQKGELHAATGKNVPGPKEEQGSASSKNGFAGLSECRVCKRRRAAPPLSRGGTFNLSSLRVKNTAETARGYDYPEKKRCDLADGPFLSSPRTEALSLTSFPESPAAEAAAM